MRILFVRLDHIGDMLLSTPLLAALRSTFPGARIDVLTNEYAAPVLAGNTDVARVYTYRKWHHAQGLGGKLRALRTQLQLLQQLRATHYDVAVLGKPETDRRQRAMMRWVRASRVIAARGDALPRTRGLTDVLRWEDAAGPHFVQQMLHLATPLVTGRQGRCACGSTRAAHGCTNTRWRRCSRVAALWSR
jgi:ADP-heptose:LPS heptosyltransferase